MANEFFEVVDADTLRHYADPKDLSKAAMQARIADIDAVLALSDRELLVTLEGTAIYNDVADARRRWEAEKAELENLVGHFTRATETKTFTVVSLPITLTAAKR